MEIALTRCRLRPWTKEDLHPLVRYADNPKIAGNMRDAFPHPYTLEAGQKWLTTAAREPRNWFFAIEMGGEPVGGVGLVLFSDVYRYGAEIGYWVAEPFWGRGLATEAVTGLADHAFGSTDLVRLQAAVFEYNVASMRVLEKAGFFREAVHHRSVFKHGRFWNEVIFARLRP